MQQFITITMQVFKIYYFLTTHFQIFNEEKLANIFNALLQIPIVFQQRKIF